MDRRIVRIARALVAVALAGALAACGGGEEPPAEGAGRAQGRTGGEARGGGPASDPGEAGEAGGPGQTAAPGAVRAEMRGVLFRIDPEVALEIRALAGSLVPTQEGEAPYFDDPTTFALAIDSAEIALAPESLAAIMNRDTFAYDGAPLSDLSVEIRDGELYQEGTLNKAGGVPFSMLGKVAVTDEGDIQLEPDEMHVAGLPVENLMNLFGVELAQVVNADEARGLRIEEDRIVLDPERLLPPPAIRGKVREVRVEPDRLVQVFGDGKGEAGLTAPVEDRGHMFFRGHVLRFGKLTMNGADLEIADADPSDPFEFYLEEYAKQLTAGYSKTLSDQGLVAYMPDYSEAAGASLP